MTTEEGATWSELLEALSPKGGSALGISAAWSEIRERLLRYGALELHRQSLTTIEDVEEVVDDLLLLLTQEDFLAKARGVRGHAGYFRLIIRRRLIDRARKEQRELRVREEAIPLPETWPSEARTGRTDQSRALAIALTRLRPEDRHLLELSFVQGRRLSEIGQILGIKPGSAAVRLHRLIKKLRVELGQNPHR